MREGGTVVFDQRHRAAGPQGEQEQRDHHAAAHHQQQARCAPGRVNHGQQNQRNAQRERGGQAARQRCHAECESQRSGHDEGTARAVRTRWRGGQHPQQQGAGSDEGGLGGDLVRARQQSWTSEQGEYREPPLSVAECGARCAVGGVDGGKCPHAGGEARRVMPVQYASQQFDE